MRSELSVGIVNKIMLARYHYQLADSCFKVPNDICVSSGINLLQDAVEFYLLAIAEFVGADIPSTTSFDRYFELINKKLHSLGQDDILFRNQLIALNKARVNVKHYAILQHRGESLKILIIVKEFFAVTSRLIFKKDFWQITLVDLLSEGLVKKLLQEAEKQIRNEQYADCLITCRKVLYLEIEKDYDISEYNTEFIGYLTGLLIKAPRYARSKDYIDKNVLDPTDYIVIDREEIDKELLHYGIDRVIFWNIWNLTPPLYIPKGLDVLNQNNWIIRNVFELFGNNIKENAEYVFNETISIAFAIHSKKQLIKGPQYYMRRIKVKGKNIPIYKKWNLEGEIIGYIKSGKESVSSDCAIVDQINKFVSYKIYLWGDPEAKAGPTIGYISDKYVINKRTD